VSVLWHDLECGAYDADIRLWRTLADEHGEPVLDVGAGTGRIAIDLAQHGHRVTALDRDPVLVAELARRAPGLDITPVCSDARDFELDERFALIIVPMQTIQLFGGRPGRAGFLACAARQLRAGGVVAVAITETLERYSLEDGLPLPIPDIRELDGIVYSSQPTAIREDREGFILERVRETITANGDRETEQDVVRLDRLSAAELEREAGAAGLAPLGRWTIPATRDHVGSVVVMLGG
jgi:SAM-dependent methyltransferase